MVNALNAVEGDLSNNHEALRAELAGMTLELPYGPVSLDENRHGIVDVYLSQLVLDGEEVVQETVALIPQVDQTFGGTFSATPQAPPGTSLDVRRPTCRGAGARYRLSTVSRRSR